MNICKTKQKRKSEEKRKSIAKLCTALNLMQLWRAIHIKIDCIPFCFSFAVVAEIDSMIPPMALFLLTIFFPQSHLQKVALVGKCRFPKLNSMLFWLLSKLFILVATKMREQNSKSEISTSRLPSVFGGTCSYYANKLKWLCELRNSNIYLAKCN